jgi:hypoxanthine phosphoribosyltransferase
MKEKVFYSWEWLDKTVMELGETILSSKTNIEYVTGVPRGGLIPAVMLSHYMNKKFKSYNEVIEMTNNVRQKVLVVDDISDSGETLYKAETFGFQTATLTVRHSTIFIPDFYGERIEDDRWLVFPWEREDSKTVQDYLVSSK